MTTDAEALLTDLFEAFNRRDFEVFSALLHEQIDWPDQSRGGRVVGREAIRQYWAYNDLAIQVEVTPIAFARLADGRMQVDVNMVVRNLAGALWSDIQVRQYYTLRDGLVARMDVEPYQEQDHAP